LKKNKDLIVINNFSLFPIQSLQFPNRLTLLQSVLKCRVKGGGHWGVTNITGKIGKYQNTVLRIDKIPIPHL